MGPRNREITERARIAARPVRNANSRTFLATAAAVAGNVEPFRRLNGHLRLRRPTPLHDTPSHSHHPLLPLLLLLIAFVVVARAPRTVDGCDETSRDKSTFGE